MADTKKIFDVEAWRVEFTKSKNKEEKRLYGGMKALAREIFTAALVRHHNMEEAMMSVYLTGLYHAVEAGRKNDDSNADRVDPGSSGDDPTVRSQDVPGETSELPDLISQDGANWLAKTRHHLAAWPEVRAAALGEAVHPDGVRQQAPHSPGAETRDRAHSTSGDGMEVTEILKKWGYKTPEDAIKAAMERHREAIRLCEHDTFNCYVPMPRPPVTNFTNEAIAEWSVAIIATFFFRDGHWRGTIHGTDAEVVY